MSGQKVLIAGGGVAALEAMLALHELLEERVTIEILAPGSLFWYRPAAVAEPFGLGEVRHFELAQLADRRGATCTLGALASVDVGERLARTSTGAVIPYDALLVACGAVPTPAVPGALTFRGPADTDAFSRLLDETEAGAIRHLVFVVPWGAAWLLPAYELALLTAARFRARGIRGVDLALVTPEEHPLLLFGTAASELVRELLAERDIALHTSTYAAELRDGELRLTPEGSMPADRVVALPRLRGERIDGLPQTIEGFVPVDEHCRVPGLKHVYAAGDITSYPVKQGGIAAQQAQAAAEAIVAELTGEIDPRPFQPVLRGMLMTGRAPQYLRRDLSDTEDVSWAGQSPMWWPPTKIVGRHLPGLLAELAGIELREEQELPAAGLVVEVELGTTEVDRLVPSTFEPGERAGAGFDGADRPWTVTDVMTRDPLVVGPDDALAEVAERMRAGDVGSVLVADAAGLVGILTSRDLVRALAGPVDSGRSLVRTWMTAQPVAVTADATVDAAELLMSEVGVHHLPVVDSRNRPVGMVGLRSVTQVTRASRPHAFGLGF